MYVAVAAKYDPFVNLLTEWIKHNKPRPGSTAKESNTRLAEWTGWREGMTAAFGIFATNERAVAYRAIPSDDERDAYMPAVDSYEIGRWLTNVSRRWDDGEWKDMSDDEFFPIIREEFDALVREGEDGKFADVLFHRRKSAILAGLMDPTEADAEWLRGERDKMKAVVDPYEAALSKIK